MEHRVSKGNGPIEGVKCVVETCFFNSKGKHCLASAIEIQNPEAKNTQETDCATFEPRKEE